MTKVAPNSNIRTTFLDMTATEDLHDLAQYQQALESRIEGAFEPETKVSRLRQLLNANNQTLMGDQLVWIETPTNPTLRLVDIQLVSEIAHRHDAIVVVDNTFLSPYYQRPLELGADIVRHLLLAFPAQAAMWLRQPAGYSFCDKIPEWALRVSTIIDQERCS